MERKELKTVSLNSSARSISSTTPSPSISSINSSSSALIVSDFSFNASFKHEFCVIGMFASYEFVDLLYYLSGGSLVSSSNSFLFREFVSHTIKQKEGKRTKLYKIILALSGTILYIMAIIYNHGTRLTAGINKLRQILDHCHVVGAFTHRYIYGSLQSAKWT